MYACRWKRPAPAELASARTTKGPVTSRALRMLLRLDNPETRTTAGGTNTGAAQGVVRVGFRYAAPACRRLAAGHLQGPAKHVTTNTDHLLSLVRKRYQRVKRTLCRCLTTSSLARVQSTL